MSRYDLNYFDKTTGLLPQIIFACITQQQINEAFTGRNTGSILTDKTRESIRYYKTFDEFGKSALRISISLSISGVAPLLSRDSLIERIESVNPLSTADVGVISNTIFLRGGSGYPVNPVLPAFLTSNIVANTIEKRIGYLCIQLISLQSWVQEWNNLYNLILRGNSSINEHWIDPSSGLVNIIDRASRLAYITIETLRRQKLGLSIINGGGTDEDKIEAYTLSLLAQLPYPPYRYIGDVESIEPILYTEDFYPPLTLISGASITSGSSESQFYDPAQEQESRDFDNTFNSSSSGGFDSPYQDNAPDPEPKNTLEDC